MFTSKALRPRTGADRLIKFFIPLNLTSGTTSLIKNKVLTSFCFDEQPGEEAERYL